MAVLLFLFFLYVFQCYLWPEEIFMQVTIFMVLEKHVTMYIYMKSYYCFLYVMNFFKLKFGVVGFAIWDSFFFCFGLTIYYLSIRGSFCCFFYKKKIDKTEATVKKVKQTKKFHAFLWRIKIKLICSVFNYIVL